MAKIEEKDPLWEIMTYIRRQYGYTVTLVTEYPGKFESFLSILVPMRNDSIGFIKIWAVDLCDFYKNNGEKETYRHLDLTIQKHLYNIRKRFEGN